jgi:hypothetical protein
MVGGKKYSYTAAGKKAAKEQSMKTGKPVKPAPAQKQRPAKRGY